MVVITGYVKLRVPFEVQLNIKAEEFESLSQLNQDILIDEHINWDYGIRNAETDEIDVWDIED